MLKLNPEQMDWLEGAERARLSQALAERLATVWPQLSAKLGERKAAFVEAALAQAQRHGIDVPDLQARYVNLWCVWGPAFEDKPGFEWAQAILRDRRMGARTRIEQMSLQTEEALARGGQFGVSPEDYDAADEALVGLTRSPDCAPWLDRHVDPVPTVRPACDLSTFDVAISDQPWRQEYRMAWSASGLQVALAPVSVPAQRHTVDRPRPPGEAPQPASMVMLASPAGSAHKAWLHVRLVTDSVCDEHVHPRLEAMMPTGGEIYTGPTARQRKWALHWAPKALAAAARPSAGSAPKPGQPVVRLLGEAGLCALPVPDRIMLSAQTCEVRRYGAPVGKQEAHIAVYPATQTLLELKAGAQPSWHWPDTRAQEQAAPPVVRFERDGQPVTPGSGWEPAWMALAQAAVHGVQAWHEALLKAEVLQGARIDLTPQLMHGSWAWTWGMREQMAEGASIAFLRAQGIVRLMACAAQLDVAGELRPLGALARIRLHAQGQAPLHADVLHESADEDLAAVLAGVKTTWRFPFSLELDSLAQPGGAVLCEAPGSQLGALVGEAGLRPRADGQGWAWYCSLKLEAALLAVRVMDPMRGHTVVEQPLWPETTLLDWCAG